MYKFFKVIFFLITASFHTEVYAQVKLEANKTTLELNEELILQLTITGAEKSKVSNFPELDGFKRRNRTVSHSQINLNGKKVLQHIVKQIYIAQKTGKYEVDNLEFKVNGEQIKFKSITLVINGEEDNQEIKEESISIKDEVQLFLYVNKSIIYIGEGLRLNVGFYVPKSNTSEISFGKNLNAEILQMAKVLEPDNSLINRKNIQEIKGEEISFKNDKFVKYTLYESVYYPLRGGNIYIPSVGININQVNEKDTTAIISKRYITKPFSVKVLDLPNHRLKNKVPVGVFSISKPKLPSLITTGKIYSYSLKVRGEGNVKTLTVEKPTNDLKFDFYPPEIDQRVTPGSNYGEKIFTFKIFPKDTGRLDIGYYFPLVYFNTQKQNYDTLTYEHYINISGDRIESSDDGNLGIYNGIERLNIAEKSINIRKIIKNIANIILILTLAGTFFLFDWRKSRSEEQ